MDFKDALKFLLFFGHWSFLFVDKAMCFSEGLASDTVIALGTYLD